MSAYLYVFVYIWHVHACWVEGWKTEALAESARLRQEVQVLEEAKKAKDQPRPQVLLRLGWSAIIGIQWVTLIIWIICDHEMPEGFVCEYVIKRVKTIEYDSLEGVEVMIGEHVSFALFALCKERGPLWIGKRLARRRTDGWSTLLFQPFGSGYANHMCEMFHWMCRWPPKPVQSGWQLVTSHCPDCEQHMLV